MAISRFLHLLVACLLVTLSVGAQAAAPTRDEELTIVVVDRGILQKPGWRTKGHGGLSWIYNEIARWAQIPVVMPSRKDFSDISTAVMRRSIYEDLKARVSAARAAGNSRIEIQLVEDISAFGYLDPDNQRDVDRFGAAAYGAIVDINRELSAKGVRVRNEAVLGSNGTKVWAANVENWRIDGKSIWASVDLYDGRAEMLSAVRAIKAAGPSIVRIFNTRGDIWALDLIGFGEWVVSRGLIQNYFQSIAKVQTTTAIKDLIPEVKAYYLRRNGFFNEHISGMTADNTFSVSENLGTKGGYSTLPGKFTGGQLARNQTLPAAPSRSTLTLPKAAAGRIPLWRERAEDWAELLHTYSNELHEKHRGQNQALPYVALAAQAQVLYLAIRKEVDNASGAPVVTLSNDLVESSLRFMLDAIDVRERLKKRTGEGLKHMDFLDGLVDIGGFALRVASEGTVDAEAVKKLQDGTLKLGKEGLLSQARKALEKLYHISRLEGAIKATQAEINEFSRTIQGTVRPHAKTGAPGSIKFLELQLRLKDTERELAMRRTLVDKGHRNIAAVLLMLDAIPEFSAAVVAHRAAGNQWTLDVIDRYSDAVIMLSASFLTSQVILRAPALGYFASTARDALVMGSRHVRDTAKLDHPAFSFVWQTQKSQILDQYATYCERQRMLRKPAKTLTEYFVGVNLAAAGIRAPEVEIIDKGVHAENERMALAADPPRKGNDGNKATPTSIQPDRLPTPRMDSSAPPWCVLFPGRDGCGVSPLPPPRRSPPAPAASSCANPPCEGPRSAVKASSCAKPPCDDEPPPPPPSPNGPHRPIGGAEARAIAELTGNALPEITGVVFDEVSQRLILVGERQVTAPVLREADLAMALWLVFGPRPADPQFSLDPADPRNPRGKWLKAVYLPAEMAGTAFGEGFFVADFSMKQLSFGIKVTDKGTIEERTLATPKFKSVRDLMVAAGHIVQGQHQWTRLWIFSDKMIVRLSDNALSFVTATMGVRSCAQVPDPSSPTGLRDDDCAKDSIESQWAKQFTARYDEVAKELPEFARLTELAKAIAIAKWLKRQGISIDLNWAVNQVRTQAIKGTSQVTALSVNWKSEQRIPFNDTRGQGIQTLTQTLNLFGGVDLTVNPEYVPDRGSAQRLRQAVLRGLNENRGKPVFEVEVEGRTFYAKVLPITPSGQAMWRDPKVSGIRAVK